MVTYADSADGQCPHYPILCSVTLGKQLKSADLIFFTHSKGIETSSLDCED